MLSIARPPIPSPGGSARRSLHLLFGTANIPHPSKRDKGGEDAFFADPATGAFGVADGVGGSARNGVDPGVFSRTMLRHAELRQQNLPRYMKATRDEGARALSASSTAELGCAQLASTPSNGRG